MWSVWSESVDIYLGQGMALVKRRGQGHQREGAQCLQFAPDMMLEQKLAQVTQALDSDEPTKAPKRARKRVNLHITLSAALCPATALAIPKGVTAWPELHHLAQASVAAGQGAGVGPWLCELDPQHPGVAASITSTFMAELQRWAASQQGRLASVQPLWALASQSTLAKQSKLQGLLLQEPDGVTVLAQHSQGKTVAASLALPTTSQAQIRRWLISQGLSEDQLLHVYFHAQAQVQAQAQAQAQQTLAHGPKAWPSWSSWPGHWSAA